MRIETGSLFALLRRILGWDEQRAPGWRTRTALPWQIVLSTLGCAWEQTSPGTEVLPMARRLPHTQDPDVRVLSKIVERPTTGLNQELTMVTGRWLTDGAHTDQALARMSETIHRFAARLQAAGVTSSAAVTADTARGVPHRTHRRKQDPGVGHDARPAPRCERCTGP